MALPMSDWREQTLAWIGAVLAALYFVWLAFALVQGAAGFSDMFEGLGAEVPPATAFLVHHYRWLFPVTLGGLALLVLGKELLFRDKRLSLMATLVVVIIGRWGVDFAIALYYVPLLEMIRKLSS